ncbi:MAG: 4-hydroxy-tetrahydrodipicolinate synthase [Parachlamydiales bacterium]|jgi:4-hydroxy-tetrahydrodipicolinate synthase
MFRGSMVALVTPFKSKSLDEENLKNLISWQVENKTDAIVLCGTTGEAPTLIDDEKIAIFEIATRMAKGKTKVIAGTGTYCTDKTVELTKKAKEIGLDGVLVVVPYYNKPPIEGLIRHFEEIAKVGLPIILYHHPGRTGMKISIENFKKLQAIEEIVAIKEASCDLNFAKQLLENTRFDIISGDDALTVPMMKMGAKGVISVLANVIPKKWKEMSDYCLNHEYDKAQEVYDYYNELVNSMFLETNPICVKYVLSLMGKCRSEMRLPLVEPSSETAKIIRNTISNLIFE